MHKQGTNNVEAGHKQGTHNAQAGHKAAAEAGHILRLTARTLAVYSSTKPKTPKTELTYTHNPKPQCKEGYKIVCVYNVHDVKLF